MPSLDWFEGFETWGLVDGSTSTEASARYQSYLLGGGGSNSINNVLGRFGGRALRADNTGGAASAYFARMVDKTGAALAFTEYVQQAHIFWNDVMTANKLLMGVGEGAGAPVTTRHLELLLGASAALATPADLIVARNGTVLTTIAGILPSQQWNFVEIIGKVHDTTGYYHVRVNGVVVATVTGADTRNAGSGTCNAHWLGNTQLTGTFDIRWDDYAFALSPSSSSDYLGDGREVALLPNAAGNYQQFSPLSSTLLSNVDEALADDDATYNYETTVGEKDSFGMTDLPTTPGIIHGVHTFVRARKDDAGSRTMRQFVRIGSTDYEGSDVPLNDAYLTSVRILPTSPATAAPWTEVEVNGLELGYKVQA